MKNYMWLRKSSVLVITEFSGKTEYMSHCHGDPGVLENESVSFRRKILE